MHQLPDPSAVPLAKSALYTLLDQQLAALFAGERDFVANAANASSLLFHLLPQINWTGFYLLKNDELVLGPFQGKPACVRIPLGKGVCGTAASRREPVVVPNVHEFPGHIACDAASNAEIVIPLLAKNRLLGVLDLDSPVAGRFDDHDLAGLQRVVDRLLHSSDPP